MAVDAMDACRCALVFETAQLFHMASISRKVAAAAGQ